MKPSRIRSLDGLLHLRYNCPHQIQTSHIYPLPAPNGSEIIVCGHDRGVLIIWRGGRRFRTSKGERRPEEDVSTQDVMVVDTSSDEDDEVDPDMLFEEEEDEFDSTHPYLSIIQDLDLPLGTGVVDLAFPYIAQVEHHLRVPLSPPLLETHLVIALACTDSTVRLLSLPLTPPLPQLKSQKTSTDDNSSWFAGRGRWSERLVTIPSAYGHRNIPRGISVAFMPRALAPAEHDVEDSESVATGSSYDNWDILIVSHSEDLSGMLLVHKLPVEDDGHLVGDPPQEGCLWRSQKLCSPVISAKIRVPQSLQGSRAPRILVAEKHGSIRIYDCFTESNSERGSWSLSLYPGASSSGEEKTRRRTILGADWALEGKAVLTLLSDGEWGFWDISAKRVAKTISGSSPTKFSYNEWIGGPNASQSNKASPSQYDSKSRMAPMTPGTRKARQEALFSGQPSHLQVPNIGGLRVTPSSRSASGKHDDDAVSMWYRDHVLVIPSLRAHWRNKLKSSGDPFGGSAGGRPRNLANVDFMGTCRTSVSIFQAREASSILKTKHADVLVSGERGFVIVASRIEIPIQPSAEEKVTKPVEDNETLLARGDLDVGGLDRLLDGMTNKAPARSLLMGQDKRRRVEFVASA